MLSRTGLKFRGAFNRGFQTTARSFNSPYGVPAEGLYSNIPFKIKNRRTPLGLTYWSFLGFFFAFPFLATYYHMVKAGNLDQGWFPPPAEEEEDDD